MQMLPLPAGSVSLESTPHFRAGAVAQMVRMPVATLRIWEQRYQLTPRAVSSSGNRLYSALDVQRIALLKQLSDRGHAIGTIASLEMEQLRQVVVTHINTFAGSVQPTPVREAKPWRIAVVGVTLAQRLQHPALLRRMGGAPQMSGPFDSLAEAVKVRAVPSVGVDTLLVQTHGLHAASLAEFQAAANALGARRLAVFYGFANESVCSAFAAAGVALLREPQTVPVLDEWLCQLCIDSSEEQPSGGAALPGLASPLGMAADVIPLRRYDDATLAHIAALSTSIACECPRHLVGLLMQLSHFETYSAECEQLNPSDVLLHAYLRQTSSAARHLFEVALERLAIHEGLTLAA